MNTHRPPAATPPRLEGIEALRALAALLIVAYHMVAIPGMKVPAYLDVIERFFGQGVPLFYVLSGFVLSYGYLERLEGRGPTLKFWINRYFRIAPLFYTMIAVHLLYAKYKTGIFPFTFHDLVLNISLLFGLVPLKHESMVAAGWSVGVEILFYLVFPLITVVIRNVTAALLALLLAIFIGSAAFIAAGNTTIGSYAYMNVVTQLPFFLAGTATFLIWKKLSFVQNKTAGIVLLLGTVLGVLANMYLAQVYTTLMKVQGVQLDLYVWCLFFSALLLAFCLFPMRLFVNKITQTWGEMSFSLYLWHPIVIYLLSDFYLQIYAKSSHQLLGFGLCLLATLAMLGAISQVSYRLIEVPGIRFGRKIANAY